ncbi:chitin synthase III catalytic subunit [Flagelloscypha sp. PMI_526]|nr:chitin synthase III catalytic subunit [Flagelloscypha sp. PMI_526]
MVRFGDFEPFCTNVPSYPWCNLFYAQLQKVAPESFTANPDIDPVGVNIICGIPRFGTSTGASSLPNIANIIACGLSFVFTVALILFTERRKAAVGRVELRSFLLLYLVSLPLQLIDTASLLSQGSLGLVVVTSLHAAVVAALFWSLLANAIVATQVVEDGTPSSLIPMWVLTALIFGGTLYVALDTGMHITDVIGRSNPPLSLQSIPLFVLTSIWPAVCALLYFGIMAYIVIAVLNEMRPMWYYILALVLFILAQLAWLLLGKVVCKGSSEKIDGSFIATVLETAAVGVLWLAWRSITEESWDEPEPYYQ